MTEHKLTSEEAYLLWHMCNNSQVSGIRFLERDMKLLEAKDKKDSGVRAQQWFNETLVEYDRLQTIKAKLSQWIDKK